MQKCHIYIKLILLKCNDLLLFIVSYGKQSLSFWSVLWTKEAL